MFKLALKSTLAKKRRLFSTALSVMLGVAFLSGTLVFTDTIGRTFDDLFAGIYAETDTYVRARVERRAGVAASQRGRMPESVVVDGRRRRRVSPTRRAFVGGYAQIVGSDGDAIGNPGQGAPTFGMSYVAGALSPWQLTEGSTAPRPGEVVVDQGSADAGDLRHRRHGHRPHPDRPARASSLVGTARFGSVDSPGGASVAIFDLATAQQVLLGGDRRDRRRDGRRSSQASREADLTARVAAVLPAGCRGAHRHADHRGDPGRHAGGTQLLQHLPARLRRHRARRGVLHDLQHVPDHRHPAAPGDGAAAVGRRDPPPGAVGPAARGRDHRRDRLGRRPGRRCRRGRWPEADDGGLRDRHPRWRHRVRRRAPRSWRWSSGRSSRSAPPCSRRCERLGCHRSPRSATCRRRPGPRRCGVG